MGIDTIFIPLRGKLTELLSKKWNIGNGRLHLHIMQIAQGCKSCITQDPHMHPPKILALQKNFGGTPKQGSPKNQHFTAGLYAKLVMACH